MHAVRRTQYDRLSQQQLSFLVLVLFQFYRKCRCVFNHFNLMQQLPERRPWRVNPSLIHDLLFLPISTMESRVS